MTSTWKARLGSFLVPIVAVVTVLYQSLSTLQIALSHPETRMVVAVSLAVAVTAGLIAALGGVVARVVVFAVTTVLVFDVTMHSPRWFDALDPARRAVHARDARRVEDLHALRARLEEYIGVHGSLPRPTDYGEGTGPETFWQGWWDVSADDGDQDGEPFLDFLVDAGVMSSVPVDPENLPAGDGTPTGGRQYVYFFVPAGYVYEGGVCPAGRQAVYMLAITDLETEPGRPPVRFDGSGCPCLWRDEPGFFDDRFDYVLCGAFDPGAAPPARSTAPPVPPTASAGR